MEVINVLELGECTGFKRGSGFSNTARLDEGFRCDPLIRLVLLVSLRFYFS